ncbi:MAG: phosphoribosylanthranilate isomerase [Verrucomicrobiota bacterium]|nr:phosphoribosylanthranilate isomerase [Verrucomicrobiota bacterium]
MLGERTTPGALRVKICGITTEEDARAAAEAGADAIGLNCFRGSKRFLELEPAAVWLSRLPASLIKVAVAVNLPFDQALAIARLPFIDSLQLHGHETPEFCAALKRAGVRFGKALPAADAQSLAGAELYATKTIVMDSTAAGAFGGTGKTFPWEIGRKFVEEHPDVAAILAGGLTPENVAEAVREVRPFGVDVTTGIESSPGRKDHDAVRRFVDAARAA